MTEPVLAHPAVSAAVDRLGWRIVLSSLLASVPVHSLAQALEVAAAATAACGDHADAHLRVDLRPDRVELSLQDRLAMDLTARDVELAEEVAAAVHGLGLPVAPPSGARPVELLEIAVDVLDIAAVRPFWAAVFGYVDEHAGALPDDDPGGGLVDPAGQLPNVWFQQMDEPRPQRNRIHFDIVVSPEDAPRRIDAAVAAGGHLVSDTEAPAFWILADAEGNEVCVCTWEGREPTDQA